MASDTKTARRSRLQPIQEPGIEPWLRSQSMTACDLFWMPAGKAPMPFQQRVWCLRFIAELSRSVLERSGGAPELFLQAKTVRPHLLDVFARNIRRYMPVSGLSRRRNAELPPTPDKEELEGIGSGKIPFDMNNYRPDYSYWMLQNFTEEQLNHFFGFGGLSILFLPPNPTQPPELPPIPSVLFRHPSYAPLLADGRLERMVGTIQRMTHPFFAASKQVFGRGIEDDPAFDGWKYIIPLLDSESFFAASEQELEEWFTLFDVVLSEAPRDGGLLLAAKCELELPSMLVAIVDRMEAEGLQYPEILCVQ